MKRIAPVTALAAAAGGAASALGTSAGPIAPHVYSTRITGAAPAALNGTWRLAVIQTAFSTRPFTRVA